MHTQGFFVDANHAGNVDTRILYTGLLINVMNAPIIWFSKEWNTVESSMIDSESVAMQITRDLTVAIRYKLSFFVYRWMDHLMLYVITKGWLTTQACLDLLW